MCRSVSYTHLDVYKRQLLGSGSPAFERGYEDLARRFPDKVSVVVGYNEKLAHRIEAGCDFFLMPSRFEPSGLNQMYSCLLYTSRCV